MKYENKKMAVCVPTHDGASNYIKEAFLSGVHELYLKYEIDIYYYDSSQDDELELLIKEKIAEGFSNLFYIRLPSYTFLDTKLERMLSCVDHRYVYDYIWPCKASVWTLEPTLQTILKKINSDYYDIVVLNPQNKEEGYYPPRQDIEYDDIDLFFRELGAYLTGMAFRIFKRETILEGVDWRSIFDKYRVWVPNGTFYEIGLIFERISHLDKFHGILLSSDIILRNSVLKGSNSHWRGMEFEIWGECWPDTINRLPDCYTHKDEVIKNKYHLSDVKLLEYLRQMGYLDIRVFLRFASRWKRLSEISLIQFFFLSIKPRLINILLAWREENYKKSLFERYKKVRIYLRKQVNIGKKIVIYGAGEVGIALSGFLKEDGIVQSYFVVTKQVIVFEVMGVPLVQIDRLPGKRDEYCVIVGTVPRIQKEMRETLKMLSFNNVIYLR